MWRGRIEPAFYREGLRKNTPRLDSVLLIAEPSSRAGRSNMSTH